MSEKTIVKMDSTIRLIVFKFVTREQMPALVPRRPPQAVPPGDTIAGVSILDRTPDMFLGDMTLNEFGYRLADAKVFGESDDRTDVRFVFCREEYLKKTISKNSNIPLRARELVNVFNGMAAKNIWTVQGHLNPFRDANGNQDGTKVVMLSAAGRRPLYDASGNIIAVWEGGRNAENRGVGRKIPLLDLPTTKRLRTGREGIVLSGADQTLAQAKNSWARVGDVASV